MNPSEKNIALEKILKKTETALIYGKTKYIEAQKMINDTPIQIKILNIVIPFILTYIFTYIKYNLGLSIFFAIITFFLMFTINFITAAIFMILYIFVIMTLSSDYNKIMGSPIEETDIVKNNKTYICNKQSLVVSNNRLNEELNGGYFSYSFWLYVNGNDNSVNNKNNWNSYRYREWKSIFYRGNPIDSKGDLTNLIQYPGFWLTPIYNNLVIVFQNGSYVERLEINNVPFNKWTNYSIVVETKSVSVYINGLLDRTLNLYQSITIMNGYNLYITNDKYSSKDKNSFGFAGNIAELIFYNYALSQNDIYKSYLYYKKILDNYQNKIIESQNYSIPGLITNSDYKI